METARARQLNDDQSRQTEEQSSQQTKQGKRHKRARVIEVLGLIFALCTTVVLFSLPIAFHYVLVSPPQCNRAKLLTIQSWPLDYYY